MKTFLAVLALAAATAVLSAPAYCDGCLSTFCGYSSECPGDCVCVVPMGGATGHCAGTR